MRLSRIILCGAALVIALPILAVSAAYVFLDPNTYRAQISEALSKQLGRKVELKGPIEFSLSAGNGLNILVKDIEIGNPNWASRPVMAKIGEAGLGVNLPPLFNKKVEISSFTLGQADILVETAANGQTNLDFKAESPKKQNMMPEGAKLDANNPTEAKSQARAAQPAVSIQIQKVQINQSILAMRDKNGKTSTVKLEKIDLQNTGNALVVSGKGKFQGTAFSVDLKGSQLEKVFSEKWPFKVDADFGELKISASGNLLNNGKAVDLASYSLNAGGTKLAGAMKLSFGAPKLMAQGSVKAETLDAEELQNKLNAILQPEGGEKPADETKAMQVAQNQNGTRIFNDKPLDLSALNLLNAQLELEFGRIVLGEKEVRHFYTKLDLNNGQLRLSPLKLNYAGSDISGNMAVDADKAPLQIRTDMNAPQIDLGILTNGFLLAKADLGLKLNTLGNSLHDFAANADGSFEFVSANGTVPTSTLVTIGGNVLNAIAAGAGNAKMNCLATKFTLQQGVMQPNGILLDLDQATIFTTGQINLGEEKLNLLLKTHQKFGRVDAYIPALRLTGNLRKPVPTPDTQSTINKVAGLIMGGAARKAVDESGVPMVRPVDGQNACVYALANPAPASSAAASGQAAPADANPQKNLLGDVTSGRMKLKDAGGALLKGLLGQ